MTKGFIRLPRAFFDTVDWQQKRKFTPTEAWVDLVRRAHYDTEPATLVCSTTTITYGYGEQCASVSFLSKAWQWPEKTVRTFLDRLLRCGLIAIRQTGGRLPNVIRILCGDEQRAKTAAKTRVQTQQPNVKPQSPRAEKGQDVPKNVPAAERQTAPRPSGKSAARTAGAAAAQRPDQSGKAVRPLWPEVKHKGLPSGFGLENPPATLCVLAEGQGADCPETPAAITPPPPARRTTDLQQGTVEGTQQGIVKPLIISRKEVAEGRQQGTQRDTQQDTKEGSNIKNKEIEEKKYITPDVVMYNEKSAPTLSEVQTYCRQTGLAAINPQRFYDYYTSRGWRTGNAPLTDWRAAARYWNRRDAARCERHAPWGGNAPRSLYDLKQQANREALVAYRRRCALREAQAANGVPDF